MKISEPGILQASMSRLRAMLLLCVLTLQVVKLRLFWYLLKVIASWPLLTGFRLSCLLRLYRTSCNLSERLSQGQKLMRGSRQT